MRMDMYTVISRKISFIFSASKLNNVNDYYPDANAKEKESDRYQPH